MLLPSCPAFTAREWQPSGAVSSTARSRSADVAPRATAPEAYHRYMAAVSGPKGKVRSRSLDKATAAAAVRNRLARVNKASARKAKTTVVDLKSRAMAAHASLAEAFTTSGRRDMQAIYQIERWQVLHQQLCNRRYQPRPEDDLGRDLTEWTQIEEAVKTLPPIDVIPPGAQYEEVRLYMQANAGQVPQVRSLANRLLDEGVHENYPAGSRRLGSGGALRSGLDQPRFAADAEAASTIVGPDGQNYEDPAAPTPGPGGTYFANVHRIWATHRPRALGKGMAPTAKETVEEEIATTLGPQNHVYMLMEAVRIVRDLDLHLRTPGGLLPAHTVRAKRDMGIRVLNYLMLATVYSLSGVGAYPVADTLRPHTCWPQHEHPEHHVSTTSRRQLYPEPVRCSIPSLRLYPTIPAAFGDSDRHRRLQSAE